MKPDSIVIISPSKLTATVNIEPNAQPGKHSFYVETHKDNQKKTKEFIFAPKAIEWLTPLDKILD